MRDVRAVELVDDDRVALLHDVDEHLHVLAAEQPRRVTAHDLGEVRRDDRRAVDDRRARDLGLVAELGRDPRRRQPEHRLARRDTGKRARVVTEHEHVTRRRFAAADVDAVDADRVGARGQFEVVARAHERDHDAELERELAPQRGTRSRRSPPLADVDEVDEVVRDLELERLDAHLADEVFGRVGCELDRRGLDFLSGCRRWRASSSSLGNRVASRSSDAADDEERDLRQAGNDRDRADRTAAELQRASCGA